MKNSSKHELVSSNNTKINFNIYNGSKNQSNALIITHGYGEHQGYYEDFAIYFSKKGFLVCTYDLRSHGKSEGKQGDVSSFDLFLDDLDNINDFIKNKYKGINIFLFGHSMGGSIVLNYLIKRNSLNIKKAIISSPWLKLAFEPPKYKLLLAKIGNLLFPSIPIKGELNVNDLSRDKDFKLRFENDSLTYDKISPRYFFQIRNAGIFALENSKLLKTNILVSHGNDDNVTSIQASKEFCNEAKAFCNFKSWGGGYKHVVFSEEDKEKIFEYFYSYLNAQ